jgi:uridine kinase
MKLDEKKILQQYEETKKNYDDDFVNVKMEELDKIIQQQEQLLRELKQWKTMI